MPKVSVVLPSYNGANFISESIDSVLYQTLNDWELIIVDDCSSDSTGKIADEYAAKDKRIKVIHNKENKKLPEALNIGFREARGDYLTWTSDDNKYLSDALQVMADYLDNNLEYSMVCTHMLLFDERWNYLREHVKYDRTKMVVSDVVGASFMYRHSLLEEIGEYDPDMFCVEDYEYWTRLLKRGKEIGYLNGVYYLYRFHKSSLSISKKETVASQLSRLYARNIKWIMNNISDDKNDLFMVYDSLIQTNEVDPKEIQAFFAEKCSLFKNDSAIPEKKGLYLYGGGERGRIAADILKKTSNKVLGIADRNYKEMSSSIEGIVLMSPDDMIRKAKENNVHIVIALGGEKIYEVVKMLDEKGIKKYSVFGHIKRIKLD